MKDNTKEAIKNGLGLGAISGIATATSALMFFNGMAHMPASAMVNGAFPAVAAIGGFVAGYNMIKESHTDSKKSENDLIMKEIMDILLKSGATTEEKIAILKEQKEYLTENTEENTDDIQKTR